MKRVYRVTDIPREALDSLTDKEILSLAVETIREHQRKKRNSEEWELVLLDRQNGVARVKYTFQ